MSDRSFVSVVQCIDYETNVVRAAVESALALAEMEKFEAGKRVLLKPNLLSTRKPEEAITTHPAVVEAVGEIARASGCVLALGDSPPFAGENPARYARLCEATGATEVAQRLGAELVRFEEAAVTVANPGGRFYKSFEVARAVVEADTLVSISKLKTHGLTGVTGAVKNLFGCVPGIRKGLFHVQAAEDRDVFAQMLVDLAMAIQPALHVMDAIVALEGEGPNAGRPKQVGLVLASSDPVALDAVACAIVGVEPMSVATTRLGHEQGLGCGDLSLIDVRGVTIGEAAVTDFMQSSGANDWAKIPAPVRNVLRKQLIASPKMSARECTGCGDCARACPVHAITPGKPPKVDLAACIRCYCCNEVCNFSAVTLRRGLLARLVSRR